jgi:arginyl-tRNA synthetase
MLHLALEQRLREAIATVLPEANLMSVQVRPCPDPKFGDYQSNSLMALAKERKMNPRQLATDVLARLDVSSTCEKVEIAGAGFLNFHLKNSAIGNAVASAARGEHLFFARAGQPRTIVIDFSSPNVAKPMHVGHIRSTILGDSLARVLRLLGHHVITDNHIGDWGTQFGMLLHGWKTLLTQTALEREPLAELERIYKTVQSRIKEETRAEIKRQFDSEFQSCLDEGLDEDQVVKRILARLPPNRATDFSETDVASRKELVKLQRGDEESLRIWREMIGLSQVQFDTIYARLGVKFDHALGESFYNPKLQAVVDDLKAKGLARESEGATAIFFDDVPQLKDTPALVQKSDGGFNYTTTDLATLQHRLESWRPHEIAYVTDGRQQLHFQQLFTAFRRWRPDVNMELAHVWFGSILGEDGKPFKTRSGETVKLAELLDEAEERALEVVTEKNPDLPEPTRREIARVVGLGAVKYADLLPNRQSDYVFSWEKMLSLQGNTAPYLQYAYARIQSIFRKAAAGGTSYTSSTLIQGQGDIRDSRNSSLQLNAPEELAIAKHLLNFGITLDAVADDYRPNFLCNYLYDLAGHFARFYEACPVLKAEGAARATRLILCDVTARVLKQGLDVLGIEVLEQM